MIESHAAIGSHATSGDDVGTRDQSSIAVAIALGTVTVLAAVLRFYNLGGVEMNPYYDAAVLSMGKSWHNFFFAAFEPGGSVAVDKPPIELWLQVASIKMFGFGSFALKLPEALAGTIAVPLLFDTVRRVFGSVAGLASAAVLAVIPISVVTSRSDTMDSLMMMLLVLTTWLITMALIRRRLLYLMLAAVVIGINFDVKLFESLIPVPALVLFFLLGSWQPVRQRVGWSLAAAVVALAVGLVWPVAVTVAPTSSRPYALGSASGSIWDSIFIFNGTKRFGIGSAPKTNAKAVSWRNPRALTRMFETRRRGLGELVGVALLAAFMFLAIALLVSGQEMLRGPPSDELRIRRAAFAMTVAWLLTVFAALAVSSRLHPRYVEALTPAIAMSIGISIAWITEPAPRRRVTGAVLVGVAVAASILYASTLKSATPAPLIVMAVAGVIGVVGILAGRDRGDLRGDPGWASLAAVGLLCCLLAVPFTVSQRLVSKSYSDSTYGPTGISRAQARHYAAFFAANRQGAKFQAVARTPSQAASLIIGNGLPVMLLESVGRSEVARVPQLEQAVNSGQVRYALLGGNCSGARMRRFCPATAQWIEAHGQLLKRSVGLYALGSAKGQVSGNRNR